MFLCEIIYFSLRVMCYSHNFIFKFYELKQLKRIESLAKIYVDLCNREF